MSDAFDREDTDEVLKLVINGESVNCVCATEHDSTPIMCALWTGRLDVAIALFERGADLDMKQDDGRNMLHVASRGSASGLGFSREAVKWVLANSTIDVNSVDNKGYTSIMAALDSGHVDAAYCLVENGANLFMTDEDEESEEEEGDASEENDESEEEEAEEDDGYAREEDEESEEEEAEDDEGGEDEGNVSEEDKVTETEEADRVVLDSQVLQHAIEFRWAAAKPLLLLFKACSSDIVHSVDSSIAIPSSLLSALGNSDIIRKEIGPFLLRTDIIVRGPSIARPPKGPDEVKLRIEAGLAAASSSSSINSSDSNHKRETRSINSNNKLET
jgi:hypothetical protein